MGWCAHFKRILCSSWSLLCCHNLTFGSSFFGVPSIAAWCFLYAISVKLQINEFFNEFVIWTYISRISIFINVNDSLLFVTVNPFLCSLILFTSCRWSLGAIMYEMLVGYPPFYSDDPITTCRKVTLIFTSIWCSMSFRSIILGWNMKFANLVSSASSSSSSYFFFFFLLLLLLFMMRVTRGI